MSTPSSAQTHYLTSFRVESTKPPKEPIHAVIAKSVRAWIERKEGETIGLMGRWLFEGGAWKPRNKPRTFVKALCDPGTRSQGSPEFWGLHYRHPDKDPKNHRYWYTDIGCRTITDVEVLVGIRVSHAIEHNFIGVAPVAPTPSSPTFIPSIFEKEGWIVKSGGVALSARPKRVTLGLGEKLAELIFDENRALPLVLLNGVFDEAVSHRRQVEKMQQLLLGTAIVCWCDSSGEVADELEFYLHDDYRCNPGMIRVYMPRVDRKDPIDFRRHRFFSSRQIRELSFATVLEAIVSGLARRARVTDDAAVVSISDIEHNVRELRLERLRADGEPTAEWIGLLEAENKLLEEKVKEASISLEQSEASNQKLEYDVESLKGNLQHLSTSKSEDNALTAEERNAVLKIMGKPTEQATPSDCLSALLVCFSDRVRVLPTAFSSANESASFQEVPRLWELLKKLANDYYDVLAGGGGGDATAKTVFGNNAFSAKESETVESSPKLLKHRTFADGRTSRVMLRHLKIGVKDSVALTIRVHFDWDADEKKLIIGHCGPHLPL